MTFRYKATTFGGEDLVSKEAATILTGNRPRCLYAYPIDCMYIQCRKSIAGNTRWYTAGMIWIIPSRWYDIQASCAVFTAKWRIVKKTAYGKLNMGTINIDVPVVCI